MSLSYDFYDRLNYLGGNLGLSPKMEKYVDLEAFFLECTKNLETDARTTQTILNWLYRYAELLSPSKIRRLLQNEEVPFDLEGLFILLAFLKKESIIGHNWQILDKFEERPSSKRFERYPKKFYPNPDKYLKRPKFVLENSPEISLRAKGVTQVAADLQVFLEKENSYKSLYEISRKIHSPRSRVNKYYYSFKKLGIVA